MQDSKTEDSSKIAKESGNKSYGIIIIAWFFLLAAIIALVVLIVFSLQQLISGNSAFGVSLAAFASLFGAVIVTILNGAFFEPQRAEKERENQRKRDREEREYQRKRDNEEREYQRQRDEAEQERKEEHERKVIEAQKTQLRKALYNEIIVILCKLNTLVYSYHQDSADRKVDPKAIHDFFDFRVYEWTLQNNQVLFWQLEDAQAIATFYRLMKNTQEDALRRDVAAPESSDLRLTFKHVVEEFELALCRALIDMIPSEGNIDFNLLLECGASWPPCVEKLANQVKNPKILLKDCREIKNKQMSPKWRE